MKQKGRSSAWPLQCEKQSFYLENIMVFPFAKKSPACGNGAIDMILFIPLALFFLIAVTDLGLGFTEQAAVEDAVRTGINTAVLAAKNQSLLILKPSSGPEEATEVSVDQEAAKSLTDRAAQEISSRIEAAKVGERGSEGPEYAVEAALISVSVDKSSGALLEQNDFEVIAVTDFPAAGSIPSSEREAYLKAQLELEKSSAPSKLAVPLGVVYSSTISAGLPGGLNINDATGEASKYLDRTLLLYCAAKTSSSGLNPAYTRSILGGAQRYETQQLQMLRTFIR